MPKIHRRGAARRRLNMYNLSIGFVTEFLSLRDSFDLAYNAVEKFWIFFAVTDSVLYDVLEIGKNLIF